jgi:aminobenzoyl-glutamate utilization protein B
VELMSVGVNYMREHMPQDARIHYAYLDAGGKAPNVVQARASVRYSIRALKLHEMLALVERVKKVAEGAALMTETTVEFKMFAAVSNHFENLTMDTIMHEALEELGGVPFDDADRDYAARIQATLTAQDIAAEWSIVNEAPRDGAILCDWVVPMRPGGEVLIGSTDVGDVTWKVPTTEVLVATAAIGTPLHSWQMTAQGLSGAAHKGMTHAAKAMGRVAQIVLSNPTRLAEAKAEHARRLEITPYVCPMPTNHKPPLVPRPTSA